LFCGRTGKSFYAGKDIEAMKRLTLHRIASLLYRFIASIAQLWVRAYRTLIWLNIDNLIPTISRELKRKVT
jgi:hypothetical protein